MKKLYVWVVTTALAFGMHTSAMAADLWQAEQKITSLHKMMRIMERGYTFRSSDASVATVTEDGIIRFHKEGTAVISMTQGDITVHQPYRVIIESRDTAGFAAEVVRLVNIERAKYGIAPVAEDVRYQVCADIRAEELTRYFSHTRPDGRDCASVLADYGVRYRHMGENAAMGHDTPADVVAGWMTSDGHRANLLDSRYNHLAVGCRQGADGELYWIQLFTTQ